MDNTAPAKKHKPPPKKVAHTEVINTRAVLYGVGIFCLLVVIAVFWELYPPIGAMDKLKEFEFTVEEPIVEDFVLRDPMRDILQETPEEMPEDPEQEERPNIHVTVKPTEVEVTDEVIQTTNIEVDTPDIDMDTTDIDIDAPEEISAVSETITFAVRPIAAMGANADIFRYEKPTPRDKPRRYWLNRAPRPSRLLKVLPKAFGDQESESMGELGPANANLFGTGDFFRTMMRFGGVQARSAVDAALHWLAIHQEPNGLWDAKKYEGSCPNSAVTGMALMALMGGGHTTRKGDYRRNVLRGVEALIRIQRKDGAVDTNMYCHSIATIALCEAYGRARDDRVGRAARKAVAYLEKAVNPDGGWRYTANCGISDMSVVGWGIQALKTAKLAQIKFDRGIYARALSYVDSLTDRGGGAGTTGAVGYTYIPTQRYSSRPPLTAAAMVVRQFSGTGVKSNVLIQGAKLTRKLPPTWRGKDFYLWYYASYAMHNMGGEHRVWWNRRIRDVLLANQSRDGDNAGSWNPKGDRYATGGRVYTTAFGALCLEVYYRYSAALNSFGTAPDLDDLFLQ